MNTNKFDINIKDFLEYMGESVLPHGRSAYKLERYDSLIITKKNPTLFYWNSRSLGGGIDKLLENLYEIKGSNKIKIINNFLFNAKGKEFEELDNKVNERVKESRPIKLKTNEGKIIDYLTNKRKLEKPFIDFCIEKNIIKLDDHNNIAFVIKDNEEKEQGYELVGTTEKKFRQNTSTNYGFNLIAKSNDSANKTLYIFESAIDLLSFVELNNKDLLELKNNEILQFLSLSGLREDILENYINGKNKLVVCVDNDVAGNNFYSLITKKYKDLKIDRVIPKNKDFNDDLKESKLLDYEQNPWNKKENKEIGKERL